MYIVRWLMGHPIIATWVLGAIAILLSVGSGYKSGSAIEHGLSSENAGLTSKVTTKAKQTEVHEVPSVGNNKETIKSNNSGSLAATSSVFPDPEKNVENDSSEPVEVSDLGQASTEELLQMAREAYWNNGLDEAAQIYGQLIDLQPKVIEYKGELGNVYWKQGYPKKAAELYLEIAAPMIESGNSERIVNMIGFIELFYPEKAAELTKLIQSK